MSTDSSYREGIYEILNDHMGLLERAHHNLAGLQFAVLALAGAVQDREALQRSVKQVRDAVAGRYPDESAIAVAITDQLDLLASYATERPNKVADE